MEVPNKKSSEIHYPVADLIRERRSTRAFAPRLVEPEKISSLFEATRWAPSSTNEQPWQYIYAVRGEGDLWEKMWDTLNEGNQIWAKDAPLLVLSLARKNFTRYTGPNAYALYDLGAANAFLSLQAVELGLQVRQMGGFHRDKAIAAFNIPDHLEVGAFIAIGYPGDPAVLPEPIRAREHAPRERFLQQEFVMNQPF